MEELKSPTKKDAYEQDLELFTELRSLESSKETENCARAKEIRHTIIDSCKGLLINEVYKYRSPLFNKSFMDDLIQEGLLELVERMDTYNPSHDKKARFWNYARKWVLFRIKRIIGTQKNSMQWPSELIESLKKVIIVQEYFVYVYRREPTISEVAKTLGVQPGIIEMLLNVNLNISSLDQNIQDDDSKHTIVDTIEDESQENPFQSLSHTDLSELLYHTMEDLTDRDYLNLTLHWGLRFGYAKSAELIIDEHSKPNSEIRALEELIIAKTGDDLTTTIQSVLGCHEDQGDCKPSDGLLDHLGLKIN